MLAVFDFSEKGQIASSFWGSRVRVEGRVHSDDIVIPYISLNSLSLSLLGLDK